MDYTSKVKHIKEWVKNWLTVRELANKSKISEDVVYNIMIGRTYLNKENYIKIYKAMDKKIQKDLDLLTEYWVKN